MNMSVLLWLVPGLLCGLLTLGGVGGGGYWVYESNTAVQKHEADVKDAQDKLDRQKKNFNPNEEDRLSQKFNEAQVDLENSRRTRLLASIITSTALIPALLTLICLVMGTLRFMQKTPEPKPDDEESDDEPPAKPRKAKSTE
ncbi:MAG: hypothetical protein HYR84_16705 [Planctomycetes bacterium]|nr:hypothetical protein [Planctomycetota bacterium]